MKKVSVLATFFCLLLAASAGFAQEKATNFAGSWELDVTKSKLPERMRIESGTMNVTQTDKNLTVATDFKRAARPDGEMSRDTTGGMRQSGGRMGRGGMMGIGNGRITYNLDGKEQTLETETYDRMPPVSTQQQGKTGLITLHAKIETGGKLKLASSRSFDTPNGSMSIKTTETWELVDGGEGLKVTRETETLGGMQSSEMYFTKKAASVSSNMDTAKVYQGQVGTAEDNSSGSRTQTAKTISGGVINGKALKLAPPEYPAAARAVRASGAVNVQVTIDEQGKIISASAISGHPLLRAAAEEAARKAEFAPILLGGVPVKVTGIIVYNFVP